MANAAAVSTGATVLNFPGFAFNIPFTIATGNVLILSGTGFNNIRGVTSGLTWTDSGNSSSATVGAVTIRYDRATRVCEFFTTAGINTASTLWLGINGEYDDSGISYAWLGACSGCVVLGPLANWRSGDAQMLAGGFYLSPSANISDLSFCATQTWNGTANPTYTATINWYGVTFSPTSNTLNRSDAGFVFPVGTSGIINGLRTMNYQNIADATAFGGGHHYLGGPSTLAISNIASYASQWHPGRAFRSTTDITPIGNYVTNFTDGVGNNYTKSGQYGPNSGNDKLVWYNPASTGDPWQINAPTAGVSNRSAVPLVYYGFQFISKDANRTGHPLAFVNTGWQGYGGATNATYEIAIHSRRIYNFSDTGGVPVNNAFVVITDGTAADQGRTRFLPVYSVNAAGVVQAPVLYNSANSISQSGGATTLTVTPACAYGYQFYAVGVASYTNFLTTAVTNSLSPLGVGFDPTPTQFYYIFRWGYLDNTSVSTVTGNNPSTTVASAFIVNPYIKTFTAADRATALARTGAGGIAITQSAGVTTAITAVTVSSAFDLNQIYEAIKAWQDDSKLRPQNSITANAVNDALNYTPANLTFSTPTSLPTLWTATAGKTALVAIGASGTVTINAPIVAGTYAPVLANAIVLSPTPTTILSLTLSATVSISGLPTAGLIASNSSLGFGTSSATTLTNDISFTSTAFSGNLTLNVGATNRTLTLTNCPTITTWPFTRGGTGTIAVTPANTVIPITLPAGFSYNVVTQVVITFADGPATQPVVRTIEVYKNNSTTSIVLPTPTYSNGQLTYTLASAASDTFQGGVIFADGYLPTRLTSATNVLVSGVALTEGAVDFQIVLSTDDISFIATTAWSAANVALATNAYALMTTTRTTDYQTISATRSAVEVGKLVWRRSFETSNALTIAFRRAMAIGTLVTNFMSFNINGVSINGVTATGTSGIGVQLNKDASRTNTITWAIWAVDAIGNFYALNNANGRVSTVITQIILWEGFAPGAVASLNTSQINQISAGVSIALVGTPVAPGALRKMSIGIVSASLLIPATINLDSSSTSTTQG